MNPPTGVNYTWRGAWQAPLNAPMATATIRHYGANAAFSPDATTFLPDATMNLEQVWNQLNIKNYIIQTQEVSLDDCGHAIFADDALNNSIVRLLCPMNEGLPVVDVVEKHAPMNKQNVMSLAFFLPSTQVEKFLKHDKRMEHLSRYMVPLVGLCMLARHFNIGMRMYMDKWTVEFFQTVQCGPLNFDGLFPDVNTVNLHNPSFEKETFHVLALLKQQLELVKTTWDTYVGRGNMADSFCGMLWYIMSGYHPDYLRQWGDSAQIFSIDLTECRPHWHENIVVTDTMRRPWAPPSKAIEELKLKNEEFKFLIHEGYVGSVYRLWSMRQKRAIKQTIAGFDVHIPVPESVHVRDAHTSPISVGDAQHIVDFMKVRDKVYEWCIIPGIYEAPWANAVNSSRDYHTPICCYVNAKRLNGDCIMDDDDYARTLGLLFDEKFMDIVTKYRKYDDRKPNGHNKVLAYGIDEILLTQGTGVITQGESMINDPWTECFNSKNCALGRANPGVSEVDRNVNELAKSIHDPDKPMMKKSLILPIVWLWHAGEGSGVWWHVSGGKGMANVDSVSAEMMARWNIGVMNLPSTYCFPFQCTINLSWTTKQCAQAGGASDAYLVIAVVMNDGFMDWKASGYEGPNDFVLKHADVDKLFAEQGVDIYKEYLNYSNFQQMDAFSMYPSDDARLKGIKEAYATAVQRAQTCKTKSP
jgi:hypothetical protein